MDLMNSKNPMIIIRPQILKVGDCCFRRYSTEPEKLPQNVSTLAPYMDNDDDMINCTELDDDVEIKLTKSGKFMTQFHVPPVCYAAIIGQKGLKRKQIEMDTDCTVKVPKIGEISDIIITGNSERNVMSARMRVHMVVLQTKDKHTMTHFISIPVISNQITKNFQIFQSNVLSDGLSRGIDSSIFQYPTKFHLTIAALVLLDDTEKDLAIQTLHECKEEIIDPLFKNAGPLKIILEGLEIMNDDPTAVDILYGKVKLNIPKYNTSFQKMADQIVEYFCKKGLIRKQYDNVKLHVTLMNSLFRANSQGGDSRANNRIARETFDATAILNKYKSFNFGETDLENIDLSIRFSKGDNSYYDALTKINCHK